MSLKQFYADPFFQIRSFAIHTLAAASACAALAAFHAPEFYGLHFAWWHVFMVPLGIYLGGMSAVFIHNATHQSFPWRWLNEACGHLAGIHQLWGFCGWKLIHLIHHQYSDDVEMDPHPTKNRFFGEYLRNMFSRSSRTVSKRYRDHWQDSPRTRLLQRATLGLFFIMAGLYLLMWYLLLGPALFITLYVPSYITNHLLFAHINYFCHPLDEADDATKATNMNHTLYYKLANFFWCGIYFHGNHHRKPMLFNPRKLAERIRPARAQGELSPIPVLAKSMEPHV